MQANNTPAPGNAESARTIEDGTPNDESPLTVEHCTPNVDYTDALSEGSDSTHLVSHLQLVLHL